MGLVWTSVWGCADANVRLGDSDGAASDGGGAASDGTGTSIGIDPWRLA